MVRVGFLAIPSDKIGAGYRCTGRDVYGTSGA